MIAQHTAALSFDELRRANVARCESVFHPVTDWSPTDWACAAAGEMGEACNLVKKLRRLEMGGGSAALSHRRGEADVPALVSAIGDELADTVTYLDLLAARLGIDLGDAVRRKFNVVSDRVDSAVRL